MESGMAKWQRSMIRDGMQRYRESLEKYYIQNKPLVDLSHDRQSFSLLSAPLVAISLHPDLPNRLRPCVAEQSRCTAHRWAPVRP